MTQAKTLKMYVQEKNVLALKYDITDLNFREY
jgi:hypothetical protein